MIIFPAVDIQNGKAVRLKQGRAHESTVFSPDPVAAAVAWRDKGARWLHVVDLDGAFDGLPKSRDIVRDICRELDIPVTMVTDTYQFPMGQAMLTIYPPVGAGDLNEQGLTFLCSAGDFDALITGDMAGNTEKKLVERFDLPDIEVLVVGHHGSRYSSTDAFLQQVRPETAIISVGDNSYGHPTQEAMDRLSRNGAAVYRTDRQGNVLVTVNGGT